jgi:putative tricarboxylic transport membrane protein
MSGTLHAFVLGLTQIFSGTAFELMLLGIFLGFVVGILPGLGGPTTLALMLPFILRMSPVEAFCFLLGMAAVVNTTGDITSILIGVPGEPTSAATIVDGHPMAKKGEAGRALGAALMSSLVGAIFGAFALASAIPIVRPLVLTFGSPEFFMLAVLGLTFVASLSGKDFLRGLISGGLGLFLATIGLDPMSGTQRYTFGQTFLWDGIGLVPITLGFFAIPEVVDLAVQGSTIAGGRVEKLGGVMQGVKDTFHHWWLVIRCSAIGTYTAVIPGIGGATTQWLAYAHAVQSSRDKERFGKGAVEGVLGPGAANNSTLGGSLITTIAFGIPASITMAILLGAFLIHGVVPGPDMLIPEPKGHLALTFSFVWITVVSNIITVGVCFLFLNQLVRITQVRGSVILPFIVMLIFLGAFAEKNTFEDLILVLIFGGLGWVLQRLNWPRPPLILGLVLGPLAENRLFLSTDNYGLAWLLRPGVLVIGCVTLVGAFYPIFKRWQERKREGGRPSVPTAERSGGPERSKLNWATVFDLLIIIGLSCALWESRGFSFRAGLFPWAIGFPVLGLVLVQATKEFMGKAPRTGEESIEGGSDLSSHVINRRTAGIFAWIAGYFIAIWLCGFSVGVTLCTFAQLKFGSREKWVLSLILTAATWSFTYGLFDHVLHIPFPEGQLSVWLSLPWSL